jgi:hypothetical protein
MLVDDYVGRAEYEPIAEFAQMTGTFGRMAQFQPSEVVTKTTLMAAFESHLSDWR